MQKANLTPNVLQISLFQSLTPATSPLNMDQRNTMTEREYKQPVPPYVSYRSFSDAMEYLRKNKVPKVFDKTSFGSKVSQTTASQLISALQYLGLLMVDNQPTLELTQLAKPSTKNHKTMLKRMLKQSYTSIFELDLKTVTPTKLLNAFKKQGAGNGVAGKCATFFSHIAFDAGIPISPQIMPGVRKTPAKPRNKKKPATTKQTKAPKIDVTLVGESATKWLSKVKHNLHPMVLGLLKEMPKPGSSLTAKQKAALKRYFESMLDIIYKQNSHDK